MSVRSISAWMSIRFNDLLTTSLSTVQEKMAGSENLRQVIGSKNLYYSLCGNPNTVVSQCQGRTFNVGDVSKFEFGSPFCYLREMRAAVVELSDDESTSSEERSLLNKWLQATDDALAITSIYDYFRMNIPSVLDSLLKGQNPLSYLPTRVGLFSSLYLPGDKELRPICHHIVDRIATLEHGCHLAIPWGSFSHETLLVVEKTKGGNLQLLFIDPSNKNQRKIAVSSSQLLDTSYWLDILKSKFKKESANLIGAQCGNHIRPEMFMPPQKSNQCFAYAYWQLLRFLAITAVTHPDAILDHRCVMQALELSKCVEMKIRQKILDLSPYKDTDLGKYTASEIERKSTKRTFLTEPERVNALFALASKLLSRTWGPPGGAEGNLQSMVMTQALDNFLDLHPLALQADLRQALISGEQGHLSWKDRKNLFKMIKLIQLQEDRLIPLEELSKEEIDLMSFTESEQALSEYAKQLHYEKLLSLIDTLEKHQPLRITTFLEKTTCRGYSLLHHVSQDTITHTAGIRGADLVDVWRNISFVLEQQSSLTAITVMANRLIVIASKQSNGWQGSAYDAIKNFLKSRHFHSHEGWEATGSEILSKINACASSL